MLTIHKVSKHFGSLQVLKDISLSIQPNTIVGLAGPSGGGKSTLLRCIAELETVDTGTIEYTGKKGFMFQDFQLFPHMSVLENLTYAPSLHSKSSQVETAVHLLEELGLNTKANAYPAQLSGGQKQRTALARSLMMHPDLLLCDEPTSGLDVATIQDVVDLLKSVQARGVSMVIASHDLDFLTQIADRIVLLNQGTIVTDIHPKEISNPMDILKKAYL
jgi:polar amino acid transport system ATP-binding protein